MALTMRGRPSLIELTPPVFCRISERITPEAFLVKGPITELPDWVRLVRHERRERHCLLPIEHRLAA